MVLFTFTVDETKCMNCGICMDVCPFTCIEFTRTETTRFYGSLFKTQPIDNIGEEEPKPWMMEKPFLPIQERCTGCQTCVRECPTNAITVKPDPDKTTLKPKPMILKRPAPKDDGFWNPLSEYTRDYLKRPMRSPWTQTADWKPTIKERGVRQTWRSMETDE